MVSLYWEPGIDVLGGIVEIDIVGDQVTSTLTISSSMLSHTGLYYCYATAGIFTRYISYNLTVGKFSVLLLLLFMGKIELWYFSSTLFVNL